jgi:predicted RND superfamily exporter protein
MEKIELTKSALEHLEKNIKKQEGFVFVFPKESEVSLSKVAEKLRDVIDECILQDVEVVVENIPYCFLVGYKRYIKEVQSDEKMKLEKCKECKHYEECSGIWKEYVERYGDKEIMPITGKYLITDNERCMIEILLKVGQATTKQLLELKNAPEFKDICAHCVGSDDVMLTGKNLMEKGVVKREFTKEGFLWKLVEENILIKRYQNETTR